MNEKAKLYVAGIGMITPVGFDAASTAAAVRAGASSYQATGFYIDEDEHVRMARVPKEALDGSLKEDILPDDFSARQIRLLRLASIALGQLQPLLPKDVKLPLFMAGPEQLIEDDRPITRDFLKNLSQQSGVDIDLAQSRFIATGRAGGLATINLAFRYLADRPHEFVIVGGVDTFYDGRLLQILLEDERLLVGDNMDGFIPGEGAAFILLSKRVIPPNSQIKKPIHIYEPGLASEAGYRGSDEPYRGDGLAGAVTMALDNAGTDKIKVLYSSMNGEHFFSKEHGVALLRNKAQLDDDVKIEHPADCFGDLGAAFGPVIMGISMFHLSSGTINSPCMVCCSSDKAPRAAMVLHV